MGFNLNFMKIYCLVSYTGTKITAQVSQRENPCRSLHGT